MTRDQLHAELAALPDDELFEVLAPFAMRRLVGPFGCTSFREWQTAKAWNAYRQFALDGSTKEAVERAVGLHAGVRFDTLERMVVDPNYYRRIRTLANKIESKTTGANLRRYKPCDPDLASTQDQHPNEES